LLSSFRTEAERHDGTDELKVHQTKKGRREKFDGQVTKVVDYDVDVK